MKSMMIFLGLWTSGNLLSATTITARLYVRSLAKFYEVNLSDLLVCFALLYGCVPGQRIQVDPQITQEALDALTD
jgi:hypothetical protein